MVGARWFNPWFNPNGALRKMAISLPSLTIQFCVGRPFGLPWPFVHSSSLKKNAMRMNKHGTPLKDRIQTLMCEEIFYSTMNSRFNGAELINTVNSL